MQRYFARTIGKRVILTDDDVFHLTRVMRARRGDNIEVVSDGMVSLAVIDSLKPLEISIVKTINENNELSNDVILICSLLKGEKMDLVLQKATELGVSEIVLLKTERTIVKIGNSDKDVKFERFNRILKEAAEQSKRSKIPALYRLIDINHLRTIEADVRIIAYEGSSGNTESFNKVIQSIKPKQKVAIIIGPEGGFSSNEIDVATHYGYKKVSLGKRILRAETASFYALSVISNYLERK